MKTFEELGLNDKILMSISDMGFENPMPVQQQVIPHLLGGNSDMVVLSQTGTGKTAAFGLPIIQKIDVFNNNPQALILSPTRELCLQIAADLSDYSKYIEDLKILPVYGGSSIESQIKTLKKGVQIIVATPGRLVDLINRKVVKLDNIRTVVMDEADEMLNMGFSESIDAILAKIDNKRQTLLFSATMPPEIARISRNYMSEPIEITIGNKNEGTSNVKHVYYLVHAKDKYLALKRIADYYPNIYGIVFCRTRSETKDVADALIKDGYNADSLHGDLSQPQRDAVMQKFRIKNVRLLVATDVAARGLDVDDLTHIINYGLPDDIEIYTHRSGRTGRAGKTGTSISIIHTREKGQIQRIERIIGRKFDKQNIPSGNQICEKQLFNLVDRLEKVEVDENEIATYLPSIFRKLEWLSSEDLIKRVVSLEFNRLLDYYKNSVELDVPEERGSRDKKGFGSENRRRSSSVASGQVRLFTNIGKMDGIAPAEMINFITDVAGKRIPIGKIDIMPSYSFFEVNENDAAKLIKSFNKIDLMGRKVVVEVAGAKNNNDSRSRKDNKESNSRSDNNDFRSRNNGNRSRSRNENNRSGGSRNDNNEFRRDDNNKRGGGRFDKSQSSSRGKRNR